MKEEFKLNRPEVSMEKCYSCEGFLEEYQDYNKSPQGKIVHVEGINGMDAYNPSSSFVIDKKKYHLIRVEPPNDEFNSQVYLSMEITKDKWKLCDGELKMRLQDPFVTKIRGEIIIGGVKIFQNKNHEINFKTVFYRGWSLDKLKEFASGPTGQKNIHLVDLGNRIGVFTRSKRTYGGFGSIGYTEIENLNELNEELIQEAPLLTQQCLPTQWWGVNEAIHFKNNLIGIIGHIAMENEEGKHYYTIAFVFNPLTKTIIREPKIISTRKDWPKTQAKKEKLKDVVFPGGIEFTESGKGWLYVGLNDAHIGVREIENPFMQFSEFT